MRREKQTKHLMNGDDNHVKNHKCLCMVNSPSSTITIDFVKNKLIMKFVLE